MTNYTRMNAPDGLEQSFYTIRFVELITENIKRQHPTLSYILRRQYKDADEVYTALLNGVDIELAFTPEYYLDVTKYLIDPTLQRYDFVSPSIRFLVFYGLFLLLCESYLGKSYRNCYTEYMKRVRDIDILYIEQLLTRCRSTCIVLQSPFFDQEIAIWKTLKSKHFTTKFREPLA